MRSGPPPFGEWLRRWTAFHVIVCVNVVLFVLQWVLEEAWVRDVFTGQPVRPEGGVSVEGLSSGQFWAPFTAMFVQSGWAGFVVALLLLAYAGRRVQALLGSRNFVLVYLLSGLVGTGVALTLAAYVMKTTTAVLMGATTPALGLLAAYAVIMPEEDVPVLAVRLRTLMRGIIILNSLLAFVTLFVETPHWLPLANVACLAHLGGALAGGYFARSLGYGGVPMHLLKVEEDPLGSSLRRKPEMARARRPRPPAVEVDLEAVRRENPLNDPRVSLMKDEIDPILDKINDLGMGSLTDDERRALERASRRL